MKTPNDDIDALMADVQADPFLDALRADLPSERNEAAVRARLIAAGVMLTSAAATSSAAAASMAAATPSAAVGAGGGAGAAQAVLVKLSFGSQILALPFAAKLAAGTTMALAVAVTGVSVLTQNNFTQNAAAPVQASAPTSAIRATAVPAGTSVARTPGMKEEPLAAVPGARALGMLQEPNAAALGEAMRGPPPAVRSGAARVVAASPRANPKGPVSPAAQLQAPRVGSTSPAAARTMTPPAPLAAAPDPTSIAVGQAPAKGGASQSASTLLEETRLIEQALAALGGGDRASARYWLGEHARRFPDGLLLPERRRALERLRQGAGH